uniref:Secreted protein n=1 Tax=Oryza punctata TaxID=4537 RepID=A0A0E0M3Q6_ORYPU
MEGNFFFVVVVVVASPSLVGGKRRRCVHKCVNTKLDASAARGCGRWRGAVGSVYVTTSGDGWMDRWRRGGRARVQANTDRAPAGCLLFFFMHADAIRAARRGALT